MTWNNLGSAVAAGEKVTVNGAIYTKVQCFVEALKCDPTLAVAWNNIGAAIAATEQVTVNGEAYSSRQCYLEALKHDPKQSKA